MTSCTVIFALTFIMYGCIQGNYPNFYLLPSFFFFPLYFILYGQLTSVELINYLPFFLCLLHIYQRHLFLSV